MPNHNSGPGLQDGGMTIYYFQLTYEGDNVTFVSFPKVFPCLYDV